MFPPREDETDESKTGHYSRPDCKAVIFPDCPKVHGRTLSTITPEIIQKRPKTKSQKRPLDQLELIKPSTGIKTQISIPDSRRNSPSIS